MSRRAKDGEGGPRGRDRTDGAKEGTLDVNLLENASPPKQAFSPHYSIQRKQLRSYYPNVKTSFHQGLSSLLSSHSIHRRGETTTDTANPNPGVVVILRPSSPERDVDGVQVVVAYLQSTSLFV
jgi:hypothetical protein